MTKRLILKNIEHAEFAEEIVRAMHRASPDPYRADYVCTFCDERPATNHCGIVHRDDCFGKRLLDGMTNEE